MRTWLIRTLAFLHDVAMSGLAFTLAFALRLGPNFFESSWPNFFTSLAIFMTFAALFGPLFKLNAGIWRYASLNDLIAIARTSTATVVAAMLTYYMIDRLQYMPRSVPVISWFMMVIFLGGPRILYRAWKTHRLHHSPAHLKKIPVLLVGTSDHAALFIRAGHDRADVPYLPVAVIDDRGRRVGRDIYGVAIMGTIEDIPAVIEKLTRMGKAPQRIVIGKSQQLLGMANINRLIEIAQLTGLPIFRLRDLAEFGDDVESNKIDMKPITIDDLLERPPVVLDIGSIQAFVQGKRVMVTGAGGSIGSELCLQIAKLKPASLSIMDASEFSIYIVENRLRTKFPALPLSHFVGNVRERASIRRLIVSQQPEIVFHAAALKHVPIVEAQPLEGFHTNTLGTRNVADACIDAGVAAMVLVSTDKAVNPTSVMGATKRLAESYCQACDLVTDTRFITVRFGNVLGSAGSVVPLFEQQIAEGGPVTVTHRDMERYFMTIPEAVQLVLQASAYGLTRDRERGGIFVLDMGKPVKIADLAIKMIRMAGFRPDIDIKIVYTGLRPGEKLFEDLFQANERLTSTGADRVLAARPRAADRAMCNAAFARIETAIENDRPEEAFEALLKLVPEYTPHADIAPALPERVDNVTPFPDVKQMKLTPRKGA